MPSRLNPSVITSQAPFDDLIDALRREGTFAFDTEFVGEDAYRPILCLLQVATPTLVVVIDPLAQDLDVTGFWRLIADPQSRKIVHAGGEDFALCRQTIETPPAGVLDLQIAAGFVGFGYPISLSRLARLTVRKKLHKTQTLTDWRRRPLGDEQIHYAAEDVVHLPAMYDALEARLRKADRYDWFVEESTARCADAPVTASGPDKVRKLKGANSLAPQTRAIADALLALRDEIAGQLNRPVRAVLRDHLVVELARRGWTDPGKIRSLRGLNLAARHVQRIAETIHAALRLPPEAWPPAEPDAAPADEDMLLTLLTAILRDECERSRIAYGLLASRQDLREYVKSWVDRTGGSDHVALRHGWRAQAVGDLLDDLLSGARGIRVIRADDRFSLRFE
jgi:ribonuclease D